MPRLPNLKVRTAEMQRRRSVCALCLILTSDLTDPLLHPRVGQRPNPRPSRFPYLSQPHIPRHMRTRRWRLNPRFLRSLSSQHPHQPTTSCPHHQNRRLPLPRQRNNYGGITSARCTKSSMSPTSSSSFSTRAIRLGVAVG